MKNKRRMRKICSAFLMLMTLSSCFTASSKNPLSNPEIKIFDERLKGLWVGGSDSESDKGKAYLHIGKGKTIRHR